MQGILPDLSSSQVEAGKGSGANELCFGESIKGTLFDPMPVKPREPGKDGSSGRHDICSCGSAL